jgi:preprotein translocase subunit SecD
MRINRWLVATVVVIATVALFIDGYTYIFRLANHIPFNEPLHQVPQFLGRDLFVHKGLDLQGGTEIVLQIDKNSLPRSETMQQAQDSTVNVMERRVNGIGVSEAQVQTQGADRVVVQLPGVDIDRARELVGKTAKLTLQVWTPAAPGADGKVHIPFDPVANEPVVDPAYVPPAEMVDISRNPPQSVPGACIGLHPCIDPGFLPRPTGVDGSMIQTADVGFSSAKNEPTVEFTLNDQGATLLSNVTTPIAQANCGSPSCKMAIFLDNTLITNPGVEQPLNNGQVEIFGGDISTSLQVRTDLAATLRAGKLPGKINIVEANSVGATLGIDSVRKSFIAGGLGLAVVVVFMIAYYRLPGLVASLALAVYAMVTLALFKLIPVTLTLAGMAGFVLSVGMAVDANVLIFERLREELRNGRSLAAAAEAARERAFPAIRDSNVSTLITCAVLFLHDRLLPFLPGFTLAKGFALTLGVGVIVSFFSAVYVTQMILKLAIRIQSTRTPTLFAVEQMQ